MNSVNFKVFFQTGFCLLGGEVDLSLQKEFESDPVEKPDAGHRHRCTLSSYS